MPDTHIRTFVSDARAPVNADSLLSGALCMALAYINRQRVASSASGAALPSASSSTASMLVMSASGDTTSQYMNYMNVFFSAQKMNVHIDSCMVDKDSSLLQQGGNCIDSGHFLGQFWGILYPFESGTKLQW